MKATATRPPVLPSERPSQEDWFKEFKVSSQFVEKKNQPERFKINMNKLKTSIKAMKVELVN
jgi:hypothetical protein